MAGPMRLMRHRRGLRGVGAREECEEKRGIAPARCVVIIGCDYRGRSREWDIRRRITAICSRRRRHIGYFDMSTWSTRMMDMGCAANRGEHELKSPWYDQRWRRYSRSRPSSKT